MLLVAAPAGSQEVAKRSAKRAAKEATESAAKQAAEDAAKKAVKKAAAPDAIDLNTATPEQLTFKPVHDGRAGVGDSAPDTSDSAAVVHRGCTALP